MSSYEVSGVGSHCGFSHHKVLSDYVNGNGKMGCFACVTSPERQHPLPENKIKHYMYQLCKSLDHMHR